MHYHTGRSYTISGYGRDRKLGYRTGIATDIGDIEISVWIHAIKSLIVQHGEQKIFEQLHQWCKNHNYTNATPKEVEKEALILHSMRMFENEKWVGYSELNEMLKLVRKSFLFEHQRDAVNKMRDGCILNGGVGTGKSRTGIYYYFESYGGSIDYGQYTPMKNPADLIIITTARKRDTLEWEGELAPFLLSIHEDVNHYKNKVIIDSWNNISKYVDIENAFFIFDEQRLVGSGAWVKSFYKIAKKNRWILLSATPGDTWEDYIPVFVANGFYKNKTQFVNDHIIYNWRNGKYPVVDRYINTRRLVRLRDRILVDMEYHRKTVPHHEPVYTQYNIPAYKDAGRRRWNPFTDEPITNASGLCYVWRRIVNSDESRQVALLELFEKHPKMIVFYNFDYELDILKNIYYGENVEIAEWNGHKHQPIPTSESWVYLVQYTAGCEGWNCITTDTIVFYSQNYSYKVMAQAAGRIDRLNTPYTNLYYYHLKSRSGIDLAISRALNEKKKFNETKYVHNNFSTLPNAA